MKAAVLKGINVLEYDDVPEPETAPNQIKVKIAYAGICGTDPEIVAGTFGMGTLPDGAIGQDYKRPVPPGLGVLGHEAAGTIVEIGNDIKGDFRIGQKVAMNFRSACGACYYCTNGMEHFCDYVTPASGAMAEYAVYPENDVFPVPEDTPLDIATLVEPLSVAVHTMDIARMKVGDSVIITGAGTIGLLLLQMAQRSGASKILVSEPFAGKRKLALELGADRVVDPINEDLLAVSNEFTVERGFNICFEASGQVKVAEQLVLLAERCGTVVWAAVYPHEARVPVSPFYMYTKELTIRGVLISPYSFPRSVQMLPKLNLRPMIKTYPLKDVTEAFKAHKEGKGIKILLQP
jgi:2-desacetyl-2-hydroxyethyl bacteriochlorophyllide A dehydrogenase